MSDMGPNPKRYRDMSVPHPTRDTANKELEDFFAAVAEARVTHRIADVHVLAVVRWEDGEDEGEGMGRMHLGDNLRALPMLAEAYGRERTDFDRLISGKKAGRDA